MVDRVVIDMVNQLRTNPLKVSRNLAIKSRMTDNPELKNNYISTSELLQPCLSAESLVESTGLNQIAHLLLSKTLYYKLKPDHNFASDLESFCKSCLESAEDISVLTDIGNLEYLNYRLINEPHDQKRIYKQLLFSQDYKHIGVSTRELHSSNTDVTFIVIAKSVVEKTNTSLSNTSLKDPTTMFQILDKQNVGYINTEQLSNEVDKLDYPNSSPKFSEFIKSLNLKDSKTKASSTQAGIDLQAFIECFEKYNLKKSDFPSDIEYYRKIFSYFVDDTESNTISYSNLRRILKSLSEESKFKDAKSYMKWASSNGNELTFQEFFSIMK